MDAPHVVLCEKHYPFPPNHGRATRVVTLAKTLRDRGFPVTLLVCDGTDATLEDGTRVRTIPPTIWPVRELALWLRLRRIDRESRVDFFQVQNDVFVVAGILARLAGFRVLYDAQVVETDYWSAVRSGSLRERVARRVMPVCERLLCRVSERISTLSEHDAARFEELYDLPPGRVIAVPMTPGHPVAAVGTEARSGPPVVLFLGSYRHRPNVDAIDLIAKEIRPRVLRRIPDAVFRIVGKDLPVDELASEGLEPHADVEDVTVLVDTATVCLAPVRVGSGVRTKLVEYMSRGKPVVAMTPALEGLPVRPGVDLLVADDLDSFADRVVELLQDPEARRRIGASGLRRIMEPEGRETTERALSALYARDSGTARHRGLGDA